VQELPLVGSVRAARRSRRRRRVGLSEVVFDRLKRREWRVGVVVSEVAADRGV